jgi:AsmA protein
LGAAPTLSNVSLQPLLVDLVQKDMLIGRGTVTVNVSATGKTVSALKKGLNGTLQLQLRNGAVKGVNLAQSLREFKSMLGAGTDSATQADQTRQTDFSEMNAQVVFANGLGTVRSLNLKAPLLRVEQGDPARIDVPNASLDMVVLVHVAATSTGQEGKELAQLKNVAIPVHLTGALDAPAYKIQWSKVGTDFLKETVKTQIEEKLGIGDKAQRDQLKDNVRERLKGLFNR